MLWKISLLLLCACAPYFRASAALPIQTEDDNDERSFKRELELFDNQVMDDWKHDDRTYMSREELQEEQDALTKKRLDKDREEDKRWLNVDAIEDSDKTSPADRRELPGDGEIFQGDIVMSSFVREVFNGEASKRDAISLQQYYWPNAIVHYAFDPKIDEASEEQIKSAINDYHRCTCIKFVQKVEGDGVTDYVLFVSNGTSCYSNVGRHGGVQTVSIGRGCLRHGTSLHEMMHVLGFFHEMARPDRDKFVNITWDNIEEGLKHNFRKIPQDMDLQTGTYNIDSILHYSNFAFSRNGEPTITYQQDPSRRFGQRTGFTAGDVMEINNLYKCSDRFNRRFRHLDMHHILTEQDMPNTIE